MSLQVLPRVFQLATCRRESESISGEWSASGRLDVKQMQSVKRRGGRAESLPTVFPPIGNDLVLPKLAQPVARTVATQDL